MKSEPESDIEILQSHKEKNPISDPKSEVRVRNSNESVHPSDCSCVICFPLRFLPFNSISEDAEKEKHDLFNEE